MRIKVFFRTDRFMVNLYRHRMISLVKEAISRTGKDALDLWYDGKVPKPFTFNVFVTGEKEIKEVDVTLDDTVIKEKVYHIHQGYVILTISSPDVKFMLDVVSGLQEMDSFNFSTESFFIDDRPIVLFKERLSVLSNVWFSGNIFKVKTLSPIIVEDKNDNPILFDDDRFIDELNAIMDKKLASWRENHQGLRSRIHITPIEMEKRNVKYTINGFRQKTKKPFMYKTGNYGTFLIQAHPLDMYDIYYMGLGNRTGQGFGMLEVI